MPAYGLIDAAIDGLQFGSNPRIESAIAQEPIGYGLAVFGKDGVDNACWKAHQDKVVALGSGALVASNSVDISFTWTPTTGALAGIAQVVTITPVVYATSDAATITAIIAAINANATVVAINAAVPNSLVAVPTGVAYSWAIQGDAGDITGLSAVVTLGAGQITYTYTYSEWKRFLGVSAFTQRGGRLYGAGNSNYPQYEPVNIVSLGELWVSCNGVSVKNGENAYVVIAPGATQGQHTNVSTTPNFDSKTHFRSNANSGRAVLGVRYGITL